MLIDFVHQVFDSCLDRVILVRIVKVKLEAFEQWNGQVLQDAVDRFLFSEYLEQHLNWILLCFVQVRRFHRVFKHFLDSEHYCDDRWIFLIHVAIMFLILVIILHVRVVFLDVIEEPRHDFLAHSKILEILV